MFLFIDDFVFNRSFSKPLAAHFVGERPGCEESSSFKTLRDSEFDEPPLSVSLHLFLFYTNDYM